MASKSLKDSSSNSKSEKTEFQKKKGGDNLHSKLPTINPVSKCRLRLLRQERVKDYLLMEEEFIKNQELLKPQEEKH